jgi:hypothetical protein
MKIKSERVFTKKKKKKKKMKTKTRPFSLTLYENQFKWNKDLNERLKTLKLQGENT